MISPTTELEFAFQAVREASVLAKRIKAEMVSAAVSKKDLSPVTVADFAVQALIASRLGQAFPDEALVAEEDATLLRAKEGTAVLAEVTHLVKRFISNATPEKICHWVDRGTSEPGSRFWTLDPIDGTKGFLRGGQYAIALALIVNGQIQVAALGCPELSLPRDARVPLRQELRRTSRSLARRLAFRGLVAFAARNQGARAQSLAEGESSHPLHVSSCADATRARFIRSIEGQHTDISYVDRIARALGVQSPPIAMDSQAKYVLLAAGEAELLVRRPTKAYRSYREKIWDHAAGALLLEEAGGRVTDLDGRPLDFSRGRSLSGNFGILASNGPLHDPAMREIRAIRG